MNAVSLLSSRLAQAGLLLLSVSLPVMAQSSVPAPAAAAASQPKPAPAEPKAAKPTTAASDRVACACNDPGMKAHVTHPKYGRGNLVVKGNATDNGIVASFLKVTLPPYAKGGPIVAGQKPQMAPAQDLQVALSGGETPKEVCEKLATRINRETGFQAEVKKLAGGYELVISDKLRAL